MSAATGPRVPTDRLPDSAYARMALVLRVGLVASLAVFSGALVADLALHPHATWSSSESNPSGGLLSPAALSAGLAAGSPLAYLTVGVLLLVATPLLRVLSGLYYFERHGETTIAAVAIAVFLLLLFGLFVLGPLVR